MATRLVFEQELQELRKSVADMGYQVESNYDRLFAALPASDFGTVEALVKNDRDVNDMERAVEAQCLHLITKQQPIARDLRVVSASLKVVTDIERIGDHVADIAELALRGEYVDLGEISDHLEPMIAETREQMHRAIEAFVSRDASRVREVTEGDDVVDSLFAAVQADVIRFLRRGTGREDACVDVLLIAKYLERIGDHAVNIGEWESFQESGSIDHVRLL
ncbi:MAG: phosphate signaling complex protein PhoU [Lachnospiraceae bacterium]|nr:phosphate signaling complex protein PhoU [Lachnospiraceae bacterium]